MTMTPTRANVRKPDPDESRLSPAEIEHGVREQVLKAKRRRPTKQRRDLKPEPSDDGYCTKAVIS